MKSGSLHVALKESFHNISYDLCKQFCDLCPVCNQEQPKTKPHKGAIKAIQSDSFRDRFQVDLCDYRNDPRPLYPWDPASGPTMRWLLTLKDHSTRFQMAAPLPNKTA